jgi:hypothetical protein
MQCTSWCLPCEPSVLFGEFVPGLISIKGKVGVRAGVPGRTCVCGPVEVALLHRGWDEPGLGGRVAVEMQQSE